MLIVIASPYHVAVHGADAHHLDCVWLCERKHDGCVGVGVLQGYLTLGRTLCIVHTGITVYPEPFH